MLLNSDRKQNGLRLQSYSTRESMGTESPSGEGLAGPIFDSSWAVSLALVLSSSPPILIVCCFHGYKYSSCKKYTAKIGAKIGDTFLDEN